MLTSATSTGLDQIEDDGWRTLHQRLRTLHEHLAVLDAEMMDLLVEAEDSGLYRRLGYVTMTEYLEREHGYGRHAANERLRVARDLLDLPRLRDEYRDGVLSFSAVRELTRVVTPQTEDAFCEAARGKTASQVQGLVSGRVRGDTPETPVDPRRVTRRIVLELDGERAEMLRDLGSQWNARRRAQPRCGVHPGSTERVSKPVRRSRRVDLRRQNHHRGAARLHIETAARASERRLSRQSSLFAPTGCTQRRSSVVTAQAAVRAAHRRRGVQAAAVVEVPRAPVGAATCRDPSREAEATGRRAADCWRRVARSRPAGVDRTVDSRDTSVVRCAVSRRARPSPCGTRRSA